jgi:hypothetical protein
MLTGFPLGEESDSHKMLPLIHAMRRNEWWNQYVANWPIVLDALRRLWEMGKVSELKTPFYEPFEKSVK